MRQFQPHLRATLLNKRYNDFVKISRYLLKNHYTRLFKRKPLQSILSLYTAVTSYRKLEKFHALIFHITWQTFGPTLASFLAQKLENKIFPKNYKSTYYCKFMQNIRKIHSSIFDETWKNSFGPVFGPLWPKNLKAKYFQVSYFKANLCTVVTWRKKSEKIWGSIFYETRKTSFWNLLAKSPRTRLFFKKSGPVTF